MCVQELIHLKNSAGFTFEKMLRFKQSGRPRPILKLLQTTKDKGKDVHRHFNTSMYDLCSWICGCDINDAFFCFPCLFFCGDSLWTKIGVKDIKHLRDKIKKHTNSTVHMNSSISFASLGQVDIRTQLDSAYRTSLKEHNEQVSKNRYIVNKLIDSVKFSGIFELAVRGHIDTKTSENPAVFHGLINFVSELDVVFKNHIENSSVLKGITKSIQNELLDSMLAVIHKTITNEIEQSNFLAIIADEVTYASNEPQMVFVVRYVLNGKIRERFLKLINPLGTTAEDLTNVILGELETLEVDQNPHKLISQSYDGATAMRGRLGGVQLKIKQAYPNANFVHCYTHQLSLILPKTASRHRQVKIFFANLHAFATFFSKSPNHTAVLDKFVKVRMPEAAPTSWNFNTRCVETVYTYKIDLINSLEEIVNTELDDDNINQAGTLLIYLRDENFEYWLNFFHLIMPHVDILFEQLQMRHIDAYSVKTFILDFNNNVQNIRNSIIDQSAPTLSSKKRMLGVENTNTRGSIATQICDIILSEMRYRFGYTDHLIVVQLFQTDKFPGYRETFPENIIQIVKNTYPIINISKLKSELEVIYNREDFENSAGALAILQLFLNLNLTETFSESVKLLEIICTIPMTTVESERCFSTLNRVKTFLQNTMCRSRVNSLAMLSIERSFVLSIKNFNEQVIDHFANQKDMRIHLKFKEV